MQAGRLRLTLFSGKSLVMTSLVANGNWNNDQVNLNNDNPDNINDNLRLRSSVRVYVLWTDLNQPPSILPISASNAWSWKSFVSFASFNSSSNRNFNVVISSFPTAFNKYPAFNGFGALFASTRVSIRSKIEFSRLNPSENLQRFFNVLLRSIMPL